MSHQWIPMLAIAGFFASIISFFILAAKNKKEIQKTIRHLIDKGETITPELLDKLGTYKVQRVTDLRRGLALSSIGIASILCGLIVSEVQTGFAIGVFPLMLGLAFLLLWKINKYD